jgi:hypothetical protein
LFIEPGDTDRHDFLPPAIDLFTWAVANERAILTEAVRDEVLELYNEVWRQRPARKLTARDLISRLQWELLVESDNDVVPVEFT